MSATVSEILDRHSATLAEHGVESPRLQIELLLADAMQLPRLNLCLELNRMVPNDIESRVEAAVHRRANREPLQHIVGSVSFCGIEIGVGPGVFIPRPETELLAEKALEQLEALQEVVRRNLRVLDFCTGSGCIAIFLTLKAPFAEVFAIEKSEIALAAARRNAQRHGVDGRIDFVRGDSTKALPEGFAADLVVSNPPYIPTAEIAQLPPEVRDFDPVEALDGGVNGMDCYEMLAKTLPGILKPNGRWISEFGDGQADLLQNLLNETGWAQIQFWPDYSGRLRMFQAMRRG